MDTKKKIIIGIVGVIAVVTLVGCIGIVMNKRTQSAAVDAAAPNPNVFQSLDVTEYGLSLNYDASYGDLTYAITDNDGTPGKVITVTNARLTTPDSCTSKSIYSTVARFIVGDTTSNTVGSYDETGDIYVKVGNKYIGYLGQEGQVAAGDPCYDKATLAKWQAQRTSIGESFDALKTNTQAQ